jgi:TonB family protein
MLKQMLTLAFVLLPPSMAFDGPEELVLGLGIFRDHATSVVLPRYPESSVRSGHSGRTVVDVRLSDGKITDARILEAPDEEIARSVKTALSMWSFRPFTQAGVPVRFPIRSRVILYFRLIDGKPIVIDPVAESIERRKTRMSPR